LRNEARWWFLKASSGEYTWARDMVYRYVRTLNLKEMGYSMPIPDCFTSDCFAVIQEEIEKQKSLREKHGKFKR
jgi:hypothetical protein